MGIGVIVSWIGICVEVDMYLIDENLFLKIENYFKENDCVCIFVDEL